MKKQTTFCQFQNWVTVFYIKSNSHIFCTLKSQWKFTKLPKKNVKTKLIYEYVDLLDIDTNLILCMNIKFEFA